MPIAELVNATWGDGSELPIINSEGLVIDEKKALKGGTRTETQVIHEDKVTPMPVQSDCHTKNTAPSSSGSVATGCRRSEYGEDQIQRRKKSEKQGDRLCQTEEMDLTGEADIQSKKSRSGAPGSWFLVEQLLLSADDQVGMNLIVIARVLFFYIVLRHRRTLDWTSGWTWMMIWIN